MEKVQILPQTIYKFKCPDQSLITDTLNKLSNENWKSNTYNSRTANGRLEKSKEYEKLTIWFSDCLNLVKNNLKFQCDELKITQCWANKSGLDQWHHQHVHPNSMVSGIFYLTDSNSKTWFSVRSIWTSFTGDVYDDPFKVQYGNSEELIIIHKQETISGDLIIFPSSLSHSVDQHKIEEFDRYTISFNSFPSGRIGDYGSLSGLEISIN